MTYLIRVYGIVQGVGFRPTVARHAAEFGIRGHVSNRGPFVEILATGDSGQLDGFIAALRERPPRRATILRIDVQDHEPDDAADFRIVESSRTRGAILISPDIATCDDCRRELYTRGDRRYLHPFINCTCCGPRMTILDALPYDRERTSMKAFPMCPDCEREYHDPADRRYDAQPVCCNNCGPEVFLLDMAARGESDVRGSDAIRRVRETIAGGGIAAIKGIGGYHLCCDATSDAAVSLLRQRKKRPMKPFAVMMRDIETVRANCFVTAAEEELLTGHQKPIILLRKRPGSVLSEQAAPGNPKAGVMLPYAPVQMLLFDSRDELRMPDVLVMTSANTSGAPICRDEEDALSELSHLCDEILAHNRKIRIRADDTVLDFYEDRPYMIRRSRGYAPLPSVITMSDETRAKVPDTVLAVGGELKNSFCVRVGDLCYMSPYIGDMEDIRTVRAMKETVGRFLSLLEAKPAAIVCDTHPLYNSVMTARELADEMGLPLYQVQHHYAHVLSCMAENDRLGEVIGVAYDGTGYGTDGTIWGGEILIAGTDHFERAASIRPFAQTGGDASAREGWRIAVSMMNSILGGDPRALAESCAVLGLCGADEAAVIAMMNERGINSVTSTSAGRLFDAVSAILGIRLSSTFEGEASTALQFAAEAWAEAHPDEAGACAESGSEPFEDSEPYEEDGRLIMPTDRLVSRILEARLAELSGSGGAGGGSDPGDTAGRLAYLFHRELARVTARACVLIRERTGLGTVALTGGCYQNTLLLRLTQDMLEAQGFEVLRHGLIPPNDGGIALGQAVWSGYDRY